MTSENDGGPDGRTRGTTLGDMPPEEFGRALDDVAAWISRYFQNVGDYPVLAQVSPGEIREGLPSTLPEEGEPFPELLKDFDETILPGITHWNHPAFFAYFSITGSAPGVLGEMLAAALNVNAMVWRSSPAGTELEEVAVAWLRGLVGLPEHFDGVINDTASSSTLYALAAAREAKLPEAWDEGLVAAPRCRLYTSDQAHSSVEKAAITLGFGRTGVRKVATDDAFRLRPDALRTAIEEDLRDGVRPLALIATIGTTSTTSVDPVSDMADIAREHDLWLHVDAAYGGPAAAVREYRPLFTGWERADSIVINPHKWLFTPIDCSVLFARDPEAIRNAFSLTPEYLRTGEQEVARNLMDFGAALGRRFRSLKLWFVLRYFGRRGIEDRIRNHVEMARELASWVDAASDWERVAPVPFSTVVFRFSPAGVEPDEGDDLNRRIMDGVNATGEAFLSHTVLEGRLCLRIAVGNLRTRMDDLRCTWDLLSAEAEKALGSHRAEVQ